MPKLAIYLFGAPRIEYLGEEIGLDTRKATALLAYLVLTESRHTRDAISHLLWPDYDHGRGRANLRRTLSVIRKATGGYGLLFERDSVSLDMTADIWADVWQFHRLIRVCDQHDHASEAFCIECESILSEAIDLYKYEFMTGFTLRDSAEFDDWQYLQSDALRRVLTGALQKLVRCHENKGSYETAIGHARRLLNLDPLHEPAHRSMMTLFELNGQRSAALRQYRQCVRVLEEELGVQPLEATTELYERILSGEFTHGERLAIEGVAVHGTHESKSDSLTSIPEPHPDRHSTATLPLVARQEEWSKILQVFESITEDGRVIVLEGEAGIGKTRLAESFIAYVRRRGVTVVTARCYEGEANLAYGPLVEGLSKVARGCQDTGWWRSMSPLWLADAGRLLPELLDLRNDPQPITPLDDPGAQTRFFEAISQLLTVVCSRNDVDPLLPTILFIDDLHWADEATIEYLSYLVRRLNSRRICVLVTWRKPENSAGNHLRQLIAERQRAGEATLITLGRLDHAAVKELIVASGFYGTDSNKASEELAQQLYRETEGLPFFVVEYLNVFDQGYMVTDSPRSDASKAMFHDGDGANLRSMPNGVRDLLRAKLSAAGQPALQLLHTAAVIGRSFDFDLLREVSGRSEEEVVTALEELIDRGLVSEHEGEERSIDRATDPLNHDLSPSNQSDRYLQYDFSHEKLRELVYQETSLPRQRLLHSRVAETLVAGRRSLKWISLYPAAFIGYHYQRAGQDQSGAEYFKEAGDAASSLYANTEALAHYRTALALRHPDTAFLHEAIGDLYTLKADYDEALASYEMSAAMIESSDMQPGLSRLEHKLGAVCQRRGEWDLAASYYAAALSKTDAAREQARIIADWSLVAHHGGDLEQAQKLAEESMSLAESAGDMRALAQSHNLLGILASSQGNLDTAKLHYKKSLALSEESADSPAKVAALNNLSLAFNAAGERDQAMLLARQALDLCQSLGDRHREAALQNNLADLLHGEGRTEEAMEHLKQSVAIYAEIGDDEGPWRPEIWKLTKW